MKRYLFVVALLFPSISFAVSKTAEEIVEKGLSAYKEEGAKAAIVEWIKGSGLENSKRALSPIVLSGEIGQNLSMTTGLALWKYGRPSSNLLKITASKLVSKIVQWPLVPMNGPAGKT